MKTSANIKDELLKFGYAQLKGKDLILEDDELLAFKEFSKDWVKLPRDEFLKEVDSKFQDEVYRFRRWGRFKLDLNGNSLEKLAHRPFFQSELYNKNAGGFERDFKPILPKTFENKFLTNLILFNISNLPIADADKKFEWEAYIHQIKVVSNNNSPGKPSPEGIHQDDVNFFSVHLIERANYIGGEVQVYDLNQNLLLEIDLIEKMDSYFIEDRKVLHGVSEIKPSKPNQIGERSVLIISYKKI